MTREEARQWIPLLQAYADGAEIINVSNDDIFNRIEFYELGFASKHTSYCVASGEYRIKPQDHSKCVHNQSTNNGWAMKHLSWKHLCDNDGYCKDFREKITFPTENTDYDVIAVSKE